LARRPGAFSATVSFLEGRVVLAVRGEVDAFGAPDLEVILGALIDGGHRSFVLELAHMGFIDVTGADVIVSTAGRLKSLGGTLAVRSPSAGARRALEPAALSGQVRFEDEAAPTAEAGQTGTRPSDDLDRARSDAALSHADLFLRYFELGGMSSELELEAFCYGFLEPTPHDHDVLAHALNERFSELGRNHPVPYSTAPRGADS
jgi:anti-anti-sigma factor